MQLPKLVKIIDILPTLYILAVFSKTIARKQAQLQHVAMLFGFFFSGTVADVLLLRASATVYCSIHCVPVLKCGNWGQLL